MSEFQKEITLASLLLVFFCVYSVYVEIVRTDEPTITKAVKKMAVQENESEQSQSLQDCIVF